MKPACWLALGFHRDCSKPATRVEGNVAPYPDPGSTPGVSTNLTFNVVPPHMVPNSGP